MSNKKESLKANESEILASLPGELHKDSKTTTEPAKDSSVDTEAKISAIKAELVSNPSVDESSSESEL